MHDTAANQQRWPQPASQRPGLGFPCMKVVGVFCLASDAGRWSVEMHFAQIKTILGLDVLRCKSPELIEKETAIHLIAYNLVRLFMQRAAGDYHADLSRISFKGTLDTVRHFAAAIHAACTTPRRQQALIEQMLAVIAGDTLPDRPERSEPRAKKRRAENYHLLTKPRHQMHVPPHRNRPKTVNPNAA